LIEKGVKKHVFYFCSGNINRHGVLYRRKQRGYQFVLRREIAKEKEG
jgi:hypothetical protein